MAEINQIKVGNTTYDVRDNSKMEDYSLSLSTNGGNPRPMKFMTVNYTGTDSNNAVFVNLKAISCHPNGEAYQFIEDIILGVGYTGQVTARTMQYARTSCGTYDGTEHFYGDVFYTVNTSSKIVDFFILGGQYSQVRFTPYKRQNGASAGTITQYSGGATYYSSGTKVYGNNEILTGKLDRAGITTATLSIYEGSTLTGSYNILVKN